MTYHYTGKSSCFVHCLVDGEYNSVDARTSDAVALEPPATSRTCFTKGIQAFTAFIQLTIEQSTVCVLGNNSNLIPSIHWHFKGEHQTRYKTVLKQIFILGQNLPFHFCEFLNSILCQEGFIQFSRGNYEMSVN